MTLLVHNFSTWWSWRPSWQRTYSWCSPWWVGRRCGLRLDRPRNHVSAVRPVETSSRGVVEDNVCDTCKVFPVTDWAICTVTIPQTPRKSGTHSVDPVKGMAMFWVLEYIFGILKCLEVGSGLASIHLPMSIFHPQTAIPISTKFCTDLYINTAKVLNTSLTLPTRPSDPGISPSSKT